MELAPAESEARETCTILVPRIGTFFAHGAPWRRPRISGRFVAVSATTTTVTLADPTGTIRTCRPTPDTA